MTTVRIPPVLRAQVGGVKEVAATGSTVGEVLTALVDQHPQLREQLLSPEGGLHRFVNVYLNGRDVRYEGELEATVGPNDTLVLLPAMAGGAPNGSRCATGLRSAPGR
jgi:molybdopterin converting factor small subunit